jgi:hypothetical protein
MEQQSLSHPILMCARLSSHLPCVDFYGPDESLDRVIASTVAAPGSGIG